MEDRPTGRGICPDSRPQANRMAPVTRRRMVAVLVALGGAAATAGAGIFLRDAATEAGYRDLAGRTAPAAPPKAPGEVQPPARRARDWEALWATSDRVAAWLAVESAGIDLPVVSAADADEEAYWLRHDLWGAWSMSGTPFVDHRAGSPDARSVVVYGHHLTTTGGMFSPLQRAHEQQVFDALGGLVWETPARTTQMEPLCALSVRQDWPDIQRFDWVGSGDGVFRDWLASICGQADSVSEGWERLAATATRSVSLVTCTSDWASQPWRTVVLWCA